MADYTIKQLGDFETVFGGHFFKVRAGLGVTSFGIAVMELPANFDHYPEHTQEHDAQEEVYTVLEGSATIEVGGASHELEPGIWIRVGPAEKRRLSTTEEPARVLAIGGTPGAPYHSPDFTEEDAPEKPLGHH